MKIAVDAMGGDFAPANIIEGVKSALADYPAIEKLALVGDESMIQAECERIGLRDRRIEIVPASEVVLMSDSAVQAVRRKKKSSINVAMDLVKSGDYEAVVSAGHTGAAVAAATIKLRTLPGVERAGIASPFPNEHGVCHLIDAGANVDSKPVHIFQHAIMGAVYARHVLGRENPAIGLMSNGEEEGKGNEASRGAFELLKASDLNFKGNVEGRDLFMSPFDVIAIDGFSGNLVLKGCEATAKVLFKWLKQELKSTPFRTLGAIMAKGAFKDTYRKSSYETYGGSPLLGVNGIVVIAHGSSSALAMKNAIRVGKEAISHAVNPHIEEEIARHTAATA
ncbi:MAG: phosphate acyltransferase PlsX [Verrucomicrobia bacterium]|nr:phosphate acyltransferase PlsX [Verrucomicrobiota bacterium]